MAGTRITRVFEADVQDGGRISLATENARILRDVLRARPGDEIEILDGAGGVVTATITGMTKKSADVRVTKRAQAVRPKPEITLLQGLPKGEKADWIVEKCVELGVSRIVFLQTDHAVPRPTKDKIERWRKSAIEALRQSGNPFLPEILGPTPVADALKLSPAEFSVLFDENERGSKTEANPSVSSVRLAVGPEGGWSKNERELFAAAGFRTMSLGPYVLRTETAAVAAIASVRAMLSP